MPRFSITTVSIDTAPLRGQLLDSSAGAFASFEGWVRDSNQGQPVTGLHYQAYARLAQAEGEKVLDEALSRFDIVDARCIHRTGELAIGEMAVWVGVSAGHRDGAFAACRWIIDQAKLRVPIWKQERYTSGADAWLHPLAPAAK